MGFASYFQQHWLEWVCSGAAGIAVWAAASVIGRPLTTFWADRRSVLEPVEEHWLVNYSASRERVSSARTALRGAAAKLSAYAISGGVAVRMYSLLRDYDLLIAARVINGLHELIGETQSIDKQRDNADGVRLSLGAVRGMTHDRRKYIREQIEIGSRAARKAGRI